MSTTFVTNDLAASSRRWLIAVALLVLVISACVYGVKVAGNSSAILRWRELIQSVTRGENVYNEWTKGGSFPYPPFAGIALWPLTLLPPTVSGLTWFCLKVLMAAAAIRWSIQLATNDASRFPPLAVAVLLALVSRPILGDLQHGNINLLILFLTTAGLAAFRRHDDWLAGTMIALATAIKVTPALFIPYFAYKRQWRVVAWSCGGLVVFTILLPGMILGFERTLWLLNSWSGAMIEPYVLEGSVETIQANQSLPGVWMRLVTDSPGLEIEGVRRAVNLIRMDDHIALWCLKVLLFGLLAWVGWLCRAATGDRGDRRQAYEFALVFVAMLLVSERSWKHHFVMMLLPYATVVACAWRNDTSWRTRNWIIASLVAAFLAMASTSTELMSWLGNGTWHKYAQAYGLFCASAVLVFAVLSVILRNAHAAASLTIGSESCAHR